MCGKTLHKLLKSIILVMSILIISALILLVALIIKKKSINKNNNSLQHKSLPINFKTLSIKDLSFPSNCNSLDTFFKENYIAVYSKQCGIIKIITIH